MGSQLQAFDRFAWWSPSFLGGDPGRKGKTVTQEFVKAPDVIGESSRQSRSTQMTLMMVLAQLMMGKTEIIAAPNQIHPSLQSPNAASSMTGAPSQAGEPFSRRSH